MPFGTLKTSEARGAIPLYSPPFHAGHNDFTDVDALIIRYYTEYDAVKDLVPTELELADEPLITLTLFKYGFSIIGPYNEFVSTVEVTYQGKTYNYCLELILDNEGAIFAGREQYGIPKVFGKVIWEPSSAPAPAGYLAGYAERPVGSKLVQLSFKPHAKVQAWGPVKMENHFLGLRCIPSANYQEAPVLKELIPAIFETTHAEVWTGEGSVGLFNVSEYDPIHRLKVLRYESSVLIRHASMTLHPTSERIAL
ncbi:unnamed protein product [Fusarium langsethiae]|nr:unnamed protein product [Fusarium langsethiae]